ncbi:hypothetical protein [Microbacterium sp. SD291]|uniref:hypothetical protein n=1 Tax=Microbacterium sp. SD291 TaxID=2782007 RepID=UPI001A9604F6|nr:hypothetical protein [Microbacterium sp. SD291]MBO0980058.1 hypothetical protein [Microbacterium sp. SD291]
MKNGIVRFAALYVFDVAVLLLIGLLFPNVSVGLHALWAAVILTLAALVVKPTLGAAFRKAAARSSADRGRKGEKVLQYALVYLVELIVWVLTVWLSGVTARGFWGFALPPLILLFGWMIYDQLDDRMRGKAAQVYDTVHAKVSARGTKPTASAARTPDAPATAQAREELRDGLTPEQRRMLDELG